MRENTNYPIINPLFENNSMSLINQFKIATYNDKTTSHSMEVLQELDAEFVRRYGQRTDKQEPDTKHISEDKKADLITFRHYIDSIQVGGHYAERVLTATGNRLSVYLEGLYLEKSGKHAFIRLTKEQNAVINEIYGRITGLHGRTVIRFCYGDESEECVVVIDTDAIQSDDVVELMSRTLVMSLVHLSSAPAGVLSIDNCKAAGAEHDEFTYRNIDNVITKEISSEVAT